MRTGFSFPGQTSGFTGSAKTNLTASAFKVVLAGSVQSHGVATPPLGAYADAFGMLQFQRIVSRDRGKWIHRQVARISRRKRLATNPGVGWSKTEATVSLDAFQ